MPQKEQRRRFAAQQTGPDFCPGLSAKKRLLAVVLLVLLLAGILLGIFLIETFIDGINDVDDVMLEWRSFVAERKEQELETIIKEEKLKPEETRKFIEASMQAGEIRTVGTDIDKLMPPVSRFGGGNRAAKKQNIIERLKAFFEKFFGIG